jgi:uncharacterized RDD family membrane protein YckC
VPLLDKQGTAMKKPTGPARIETLPGSSEAAIAALLTRITPWLVTWAAVGIIIVMVSARVFHLMRGEMSSAAITLLLLAMATFGAYMRHRALPIGVRRAA